MIAAPRGSDWRRAASSLNVVFLALEELFARCACSGILGEKVSFARMWKQVQGLARG